MNLDFIIKRATKYDLPAINHLMGKYGHKMVVQEWHFCKRDIALQARLPSGELVGFVWGGIMANNKIIYIDKAVIDPELHKKQILNKLYKEMLTIALKKGIRQAFGMIRQDKYHDASCVNAIKMAFGADEIPYTHVFADLVNVKKELESLEV